MERIRTLHWLVVVALVLGLSLLAGGEITPVGVPASEVAIGPGISPVGLTELAIGPTVSPVGFAEVAIGPTVSPVGLTERVPGWNFEAV